MLSGYSTLYALVLALLISLTCASLLLYQKLYLLQANYSNRSNELITNSESAIQILLSEGSIERFWKPESVDLFGDRTDSVRMFRKQWGTYELVSAKAFSGNKEIIKTAFVGRRFSDDSTAIYVANRSRTLSIGGNARIVGNAYVPKGILKRSKVNQFHFEGVRVVDGEVYPSSQEIPSFRPSTSEALWNKFSYSEDDSLVSFAELSSDTIFQPWDQRRLVVLGNGELDCHDLNLSGQILISSDDRVVIDSSCQFEDVIVEAESVLVGSGFVGSIQVFANSWVYIQSGVQLRYPSFISLEEVEKISTPLELTIDSGSSISGEIVILSHAENLSAVCELQKHSHLTGSAYVQGKVYLEGTVAGSLYCNEVFTKSANSILDNLLHNGIIDRNALPREYVLSESFKNRGRRELIKWL